MYSKTRVSSCEETVSTPRRCYRPLSHRCAQLLAVAMPDEINLTRSNEETLQLIVESRSINEEKADSVGAQSAHHLGEVTAMKVVATGKQLIAFTRSPTHHVLNGAK